MSKKVSTFYEKLMKKRYTERKEKVYIRNSKNLTINQSYFEKRINYQMKD